MDRIITNEMHSYIYTNVVRHQPFSHGRGTIRKKYFVSSLAKQILMFPYTIIFPYAHYYFEEHKVGFD